MLSRIQKAADKGVRGVLQACGSVRGAFARACAAVCVGALTKVCARCLRARAQAPMDFQCVCVRPSQHRFCKYLGGLFFMSALSNSHRLTRLGNFQAATE